MEKERTLSSHTVFEGRLINVRVDEVVAKPVLVHELTGRLQKLLAAPSPPR